MSGMGSASKELIDLLEKIFQYKPDKRISVEDICKHPYFRNVNMGCLKAYSFVKGMRCRRLDQLRASTS